MLNFHNTYNVVINAAPIAPLCDTRDKHNCDKSTHRTVSGLTLVPSNPSTPTTSPTHCEETPQTIFKSGIRRDESGKSRPIDPQELRDACKTIEVPIESAKFLNNQLRASNNKLEECLADNTPMANGGVFSINGQYSLESSGVSISKVEPKRGDDTAASHTNDTNEVNAKLEYRVDEIASAKNDLESKLETSEARAKQLEALLSASNSLHAKATSSFDSCKKELQTKLKNMNVALDAQTESTKEANDQLKSDTAVYKLQLKEQEEYYKETIADIKENANIPPEVEVKLRDEIEARLRKHLVGEYQKKLDESRLKEREFRNVFKTNCETQIEIVRTEARQLVTMYAHIGIDVLTWTRDLDQALAAKGVRIEDEGYDECLARAKKSLLSFRREEDDESLFYWEEYDEDEFDGDEEGEEERIEELGDDEAEAIENEFANEVESADELSGYFAGNEGPSRLAIEYLPAGEVDEGVEANQPGDDHDDQGRSAGDTKNMSGVAASEPAVNLSKSSTSLGKMPAQGVYEEDPSNEADTKTMVGESPNLGVDSMGLSDHPDTAKVQSEDSKTLRDQQVQVSLQVLQDEDFARKLQLQESLTSNENNHDGNVLPQSALPNYVDEDMTHKRSETMEAIRQLILEEMAFPAADEHMRDVSIITALADGEGSPRTDPASQEIDKRSRASTMFDRHFLYHAVYLGRYKEDFLPKNDVLGGEVVEDNTESNAGMAVAADGARDLQGDEAAAVTTALHPQTAENLTPSLKSYDGHDRETPKEAEALNSSISRSTPVADSMFHLTSSQSRNSVSLVTSDTRTPIQPSIFTPPDSTSPTSPLPASAAKLNLNISSFANTSYRGTFTTPPPTPPSPSPAPIKLQPAISELKTKLAKTRAQVEREVAIALALRKIEDTAAAKAKKGTKEAKDMSTKLAEKDSVRKNGRRTKAERRADAIRAQEATEVSKGPVVTEKKARAGEKGRAKKR